MGILLDGKSKILQKLFRYRMFSGLNINKNAIRPMSNKNLCEVFMWMSRIFSHPCFLMSLSPSQALYLQVDILSWKGDQIANQII